MITDQVGQMTVLERFLYWIQERHRIYLAKEAGQPKPWTDDKVLQSYFFTNPYRENDKVTKWFRDTVRNPLRDDPRVLMATVIFRWFNLPSTGHILMDAPPEYLERTPDFDNRANLLTHWDAAEAQHRLETVRDRGQKVFTGAYMIKSCNGPPGCKIGSVCQAINAVWQRREWLIQVCQERQTLEGLCGELIRFKFLGGFMSYEIVCDLRHTYLLQQATDVDTWCNPGPGANRGLNRMLDLDMEGNITNKTWRTETTKLLAYVRGQLSFMPHFEMREIEHSLCEFDKYERARTGSGKMKRRYNGNS